jgi:hypothetical protein
MDLYNDKAIIETANFYNSAIEKQKYFNDCLETARQNFEQKANELVEYWIDHKTITINGKAFKFDTSTRPPKTHKEHYESQYNSFVKSINNEISNLCLSVMCETEINECELKPTTKDKYFCYSKLKTVYKNQLNDIECMLKEANPKAYKEDKKEYTEQLTKIDKRLLELKENPQIEAQPLETSTNPLTQKQIALLFKCLFELDVFTKAIINTDHTKQAKLIALMVGISIPDKPNNWNFYKYWNSIQSINDDKQILTIPNLEIILKVAQTIDFKELEDNIKQKIKELK